MERQFQRPVLQPGELLDRHIGSEDPAVQYAVARDTAWALLNRIQAQPDPELVERVINLVRTEGIDEVATLWSTAHETSLPGLLWRLYLLHGVVSANPEQASELFDHGRLATDTIDAIVAGAEEPISPESVRRMCDAILRGAFTGDFAIALERAASASEVFAAGATQIADAREPFAEDESTKLTRQALRLSEMAAHFREGAHAFRLGALH